MLRFYLKLQFRLISTRIILSPYLLSLKTDYSYIPKWQKKRVVFVCGMFPRSLSSRTRSLKNSDKFDLPVWADSQDGVHKELGLHTVMTGYIRQHPLRVRSTCVRVSELVSCREEPTVVVPVSHFRGPCGYHPLCPNSVGKK
jgi:hypothetical protein